MGAFFGPFGSTSGSSGRDIGASINYTPPAGVIHPTIAGFIALAGASGTGRIKITLSADTSFIDLPTGADGQQLFLTVVAGNFTLTLIAMSGAATQKKIYTSRDFSYVLNDTATLFYDSGLAAWVLQP